MKRLRWDSLPDGLAPESRSEPRASSFTEHSQSEQGLHSPGAPPAKRQMLSGFTVSFLKIWVIPIFTGERSCLLVHPLKDCPWLEVEQAWTGNWELNPVLPGSDRSPTPLALNSRLPGAARAKSWRQESTLRTESKHAFLCVTRRSSQHNCSHSDDTVQSPPDCIWTSDIPPTKMMKPRERRGQIRRLGLRLAAVPASRIRKIEKLPLNHHNLLHTQGKPDPSTIKVFVNFVLNSIKSFEVSVQGKRKTGT